MSAKGKNVPTGYQLQDGELEKALLSGDHAEILEQYIGEPEYEELKQLAMDAYRTDVRGGPRVLILPGIMGSKLGYPGKIFDDVLWIDPIDIAMGRLDKLALSNDHAGIEPCGVVQLAYLKMKLYLKIKGYDADFYPYDWRQDIGLLGRQLLKKLNREGSGKVNLVAHSMGGLVARQAIAQGASNIGRLVMMGTPNHGSFVPVLALRGIYGIVRKIAAIDLKHSAKDLSALIFSTFPGLYQMLPWREKFDVFDLFDSRNWPANEPQPSQELLTAAMAAQTTFPPADKRFFMIAGVNQETVTGVRKEKDAFVFDCSCMGDGTVPLAFAELPGARTYYVEETHGSLPNNGSVERAVSDILDNGSTDALPDHWTPSRKRAEKTFRDEDLRIPAFDGRTGNAVRPSEIRKLIEEVAAPLSIQDTAPVPTTTSTSPQPVGCGYSHKFSSVVVGRRHQHRIDIRLAHGSITEVDSCAYVLGIFRDVEPSGPANDLNERLDGLITDFSSRRMIRGNLGEIFLMPVGRYSVQADMALFVGLGPFDRLTDEGLQLCAENTIRTFVRSRVDEFATVLLGAGSGLGVQKALENLVIGFFRGLMDADRDGRFRRITICEFDEVRFELIKQELYRLASTPLFEDVEVTFDEKILPQPPARRYIGLPDPVYLIVRKEGGDEKTIGFRSSILTSGEKATVITGVRNIKNRDLDAHLKRLKNRKFSFDTVDNYGTLLSELVLVPEVRAVLSKRQNRSLVVVHDAEGSKIPWETIRIDGWSPAVTGGLSRRYAAENMSVAKWLEQRRYGKAIDLLLVVDPTENLEGAKQEGERIHYLFDSHPGVNITELKGENATKQALKRAFVSGAFDVIHYAGHAYFNEGVPSRSGVLCSGREVLSGAELAGLGNLPGLVFFNACEAGRVRGGGPAKRVHIQERVSQNVGLAEAFLRGGVANYVGTYWPVGDKPAKLFAEIFYVSILEGFSISAALLSARKAVFKIASVDWADYIHYGSPDFVLKGKKV
jgi:pimeloyl-ACP methyl ester carboxylesterase